MTQLDGRMLLDMGVDPEAEEPLPEYTCGDCGVWFNYPAEDGLCRDVCPDCGSTNITEVEPDEYDMIVGSQHCAICGCEVAPGELDGFCRCNSCTERMSRA